MRQKNLKFILIGISILYGVLLLKIVLFKSSSLIDILTWNVSMGYRSTNLIPFDTISAFMQNSNSLRAFSNVFGNIAIFMPLGYFIPLFRRGATNFLKVILICLSISVLFECLQYSFYLGSLDIDDVILNTIGGGIGCFLYKVLKLACKKDEILYQVSILSCVFAFIGAFVIAKEEFGNILGITSYEVITIGEDMIPDRVADYYGRLIELNEDKLIIQDEFSSISSEQDVVITDETKFYYFDSVESKLNWFTTQCTITYKTLTKEEVMKMVSSSSVSIWIDSTNQVSDVIVVHERIYDGELTFEIHFSES